MQYINPEYLTSKKIAELKTQFQLAKPYKHIVLDNFLREDFANLLHDNFPSIDKLNKHYKGLNEQKSEGSNFQDFHPVFTELRQNLLMQKEFWQYISQIISIDDLFITDDKLGTGLHQGANGSFLDIHIDFNIHIEKNVHRRANMLIYLNKDWKPEYGGDLEMWNADMTKCEKKVAPIFNRMVLFETNEISYHGYSKIHVPEGVTRKSIYSYFYTTSRQDAVGYHDTVFKPKPEDSMFKKVGTNVKETLKNFTKAQLKKIGIKL
ncbi:MAG: 2OG-Fe(II) oxygenase [Microscillaceae bacterium]|nr:2OG-Fe(II) oxygenase [Microscillaceae bacterium]MDW8461620.1 2OG-Fe(II) oxygenase [Cytophagales bacterium]